MIHLNTERGFVVLHANSALVNCVTDGGTAAAAVIDMFSRWSIMDRKAENSSIAYENTVYTTTNALDVNHIRQ